MSGITHASVDLAGAKAYVRFRRGEVSAQKIADTIYDLGFDVSVLKEDGGGSGE
jgi:hypothetical protein